ncbi:MAG: 6,7-dimethyl-8-ribityllumazine synthase [Prevotellaceae bacterium]|jgi:6,7-dimethyl-8-ribityllumazine synthase|nr:6,7-dimethyl-8-ribityllumazine synthase [Prevotellaceae bacterium]
MSSSLKNLSEYDASSLPEPKKVAGQYYAVAVADWNPEITHALLDGAVSELITNGADENKIDVVHVPGTFELVHAATRFCNCQSKKYAAVIVLGCVIQGETPHFDYVCQGVTQGISTLNSTKNNCPVIFGVLTTSNFEQAKERSGGVHGNKGVEAAITAIKMANIF